MTIIILLSFGSIVYCGQYISSFYSFPNKLAQQNLLKRKSHNSFFRYISISRPLSSINTSKQRRRAKYMFFLKQFSELILFLFQTHGAPRLADDPDILLATGSNIQSLEASQERLLSMHNL